MKNYLSLIFAFIILTFSSCKKELEINVNKTYIEKGGKASDLGFGGVILTLMPDGKADLLFGGDTFIRYTYSINGKTIVLSDNNSSIKVKVKVISETQLLYDNNRLLILSNN